MSSDSGFQTSKFLVRALWVLVLLSNGAWLACGTGGGSTTQVAQDSTAAESAAEREAGMLTETPGDTEESEGSDEGKTGSAEPDPVPLEAREDGLPCAPGTRCLLVEKNGSPDPDGDFVAQCSSTFPDYVVEASHFPDEYAGPWFRGAFEYPESEPMDGPRPWEAIDFSAGVEAADRYLFALRDYAYEGNTEVDFRVQENDVRQWFVVPYMNYGFGRREPVRGVTRERPVEGPELGLKEGEEIQNFGIGFYNDSGGFAIGRVWENPLVPDLRHVQFPNGSMVFKILFTDAVAEQFEDPDGFVLEGAPEWQIATGNGELTTVRLLQMDVAVRDPRAQPSEWVFGTFAYDRDAEDADPWRRMRPVGLSWGNAPGYTPADQEAGKPLPENFVSDQIPAYAASHLGWAGRVNGPVDNPISSCHSCHGVAQYPVVAAMAPFSRRCNSDEKRLHWFRNKPAGEAFGAVGRNTCLPEEADPPPIDLDMSMQMKVALQSILQFRNDNPCFEGERPSVPASLQMALPDGGSDAPEVGRGGFVESE